MSGSAALEEALESALVAKARGLPDAIAADDITRIRCRMTEELHREAAGLDARKAVAALLKLAGLPEAERPGSALRGYGPARRRTLLAEQGRRLRTVRR